MPTKATTKKPELVEFEMTAVIPVAQYANAQPVVKGYGETYEQARDDAMKKLQDIWAMVGEGGKGLEVRGLNQPVVDTVERETLKCYVSGTELLYDDAGHTYVDSEGAAYVSGSKFAEQFGYEFNKAAILPRYAKNNGLKEYEVDEYWQAKSKCSTTWGTAIHQAMETYGTHLATAEKLDKPTGVHPLILPMIEEWFEANPGTYLFEKFVADKERKYCGQIDTIQLTGSKKCFIRDTKTNGDLYKQSAPKYLKAPYNHMLNTPFGKYTLQLNFYRSIMEAAGWEVEGMKIDHLDHDGEWEVINVPRVDIEQPQTKIDLSKVN